MDEFDKIITENRAGFDMEPADGHLERFKSRLKAQNHNQKRRLMPMFLKGAAVAIILLLIVDITVNLQNGKQNDNLRPATNNELGEAAIYYNTRIDNGINQLEEMAREGVGSQAEIAQIKKEMAEMDSLFNTLKKEYELNPNDERIINAMIDYYQTKLDIVNTIKTDLEKVKQQKIKYNENKSL